MWAGSGDSAPAQQQQHPGQHDHVEQWSGFIFGVRGSGPAQHGSCPEAAPSGHLGRGEGAVGARQGEGAVPVREQGRAAGLLLGALLWSSQQQCAAVLTELVACIMGELGQGSGGPGWGLGWGSHR